MKKKGNKKKDAADYLIAEFNMLHERATLQEQLIANKINFFIAITTAIIGGILLAADNETYKPYIGYATPPILLFLYLIGRTTLWQIVDLYASSIFFYRRAGRIRMWFLKNDESLETYIPFKVTDDNPKFFAERVKLRGIEAILLLVNAAIIMLTTISTSWLIYRLLFSNLLVEIIITIASVSGLFAFLITWKNQVKFVEKFLVDKELSEKENGQVFFPTIPNE